MSLHADLRSAKFVIHAQLPSFHPFWSYLSPCLPLGGSHNLLQVNLSVKCNTLCLQEGTAFLPGSSLAGNGLLVSDGAVWRRQRQLSNPAFRSAAVQAYAKVC